MGQKPVINGESYSRNLSNLSNLSRSFKTLNAAGLNTSTDKLQLVVFPRLSIFHLNLGGTRSKWGESVPRSGTSTWTTEVSKTKAGVPLQDPLFHLLVWCQFLHCRHNPGIQVRTKRVSAWMPLQFSDNYEFGASTSQKVQSTCCSLTKYFELQS